MLSDPEKLRSRRQPTADDRLHTETTAKAAVLVIVDAQKGFADVEWWGPGDNPSFGGNLKRLIHAWCTTQNPIVVVRHDSVDALSPLRPAFEGNDLIPAVEHIVPDLLVAKSVNSAFLGVPDLAEWLRSHRRSQIVLCGISLNTCVETTARMGQNLGFDVSVIADATVCFPLTGADGTSLTAAQLRLASVVNLSASGFARIATTIDTTAALYATHAVNREET